MNEKCDRCGEDGEDRRTLWMAAFYEMNELGLPFDRRILFHADMDTLEKASEPDDLVLKDGTKLRIVSGTVTSKGELRPETLYTLRVCKSCRSDWLAAIKRWFSERPDEGHGDIPMRVLGATRMVTDEEYRAMKEGSRE